MAEYDVEEIITGNRQAGSLYKLLYVMGAASEEPAEHQGYLIPVPRVPLPAALTYRVIPTLDIWRGQGTITAANYATDISSTTATCFAQLDPTEYLDSKNLTISNFGLSVRNVLWSKELGAVSGSIPTYPSTQSVLLTDEIRSLSSQWQVASYLQKALRLAQTAFSGLEGIAVTAEDDPETDEKWIAVSVRVKGNIQDVLDMYDAYTRVYVESVPWPARDKIRLVYDLI
jgi:hypothetical protein